MDRGKLREERFHIWEESKLQDPYLAGLRKQSNDWIPPAKRKMLGEASPCHAVAT